MTPGKILTTLLLLCSGTSMAQVHLPFPMQNCTWKHKIVLTCTGLGNYGTVTTPFDSYLAGDTIINGLSYVKVYQTVFPGVSTGTCSQQGIIFLQPGTTYWGAMRQSPDLSKVYLLLAGQNNESLYYDFTLSKGDTLKTHQTTFSPWPPRIVDSVYYQTFSDGVCRRVYSFYPPGFESTGYGYYDHFNEITESLGMSTGLYYMRRSASFYNGGLTMALTMTVEINGVPVVRTNASCMRDVSLTERRLPDFKVWPNPGQDLIHITGNYDSQLCFTVCDLYGNELLKSERPEIHTESLPPGVYFIRCKYPTGIFVRKWLKT